VNINQKTPTHPTNGTDIPIGYASRLRIRLTPGGIQRRVDDISKQFTGAGWKSLPQELVDEILGYLLPGNLHTLKACSLTCKRLFGATRPLIHQRLVCLGSRPDPLKPKRHLFGRHRRGRGAFERLVDADRLGILRYTRRLTLRRANGFPGPYFYPRDLQEYLPQLRSIAKLDGLALDSFYLTHFTPGFDDFFGMFPNTLRHLDIRRPYCTEQQLLYFICQFPWLEDLTIVSQATPPDTHVPIPIIRQSPPLRGKLGLANTSLELSNGLAALPGGLHFRSIALAPCQHSQAILAACGHTVTSISYLWLPRCGYRESNPPIQLQVAM